MTVTTIYATVQSRGLYKSSTDRNVIRGDTSATAVTAGLSAGVFYSNVEYAAYEALLEFDTSIIPDADTVTNVDLVVNSIFGGPSVSGVVDFRGYDWGPQADVTDWRSTAALAAMPLYGSVTVASGFTGLVTLSGTSNLNSAPAMKTGMVRGTLVSEKFVSNADWTTTEQVHFSQPDDTSVSARPRMVITHGPPPGQTVTTVYSTFDGRTSPRDTSYSVARNATVADSGSIGPSDTVMQVGQQLNGSYFIFQSQAQFDTTAIPITEVVTDVAVILNQTNVTAIGTNAFTVQVRESPHRGQITVNAWQSLANSTARALLASATVGPSSTVGPLTFTAAPELLTVAGIKGGTLGLTFASSRWIDNIAPVSNSISNEFAIFATSESADATTRPRLVITHEPPPETGPSIRVDGALPGVTGNVSASVQEDMAAGGALPDLGGGLAALVAYPASLAGALPPLSGAFTVGAPYLNLSPNFALPALTGSVAVHQSLNVTVPGSLPTLLGAVTGEVQVPIFAPGVTPSSVGIRVYDRTGAALGDIPNVVDPNEQVELNAPGALSFVVHRDAPNTHLIDADAAFLAVVDEGVVSTAWYALEDDTDDDADPEGPSRSVTVAARGLLGLLEYARVYPAGATPGMSGDQLAGLEPKVTYTNATPGAIVRDQILKAKARGALSSLTVTWTATHDSAGVAWGVTHSDTYEAGKDLYTLVGELAENGLVEVRTHNRELRLFRADTSNVDLPGTVLLGGRDPEQAVRKRSRRGIYSHLLGVGDTTEAGVSTIYEATNSTAASRFGRREGYEGRGGVKEQGTVASLTTTSLERVSDTKEGLTLTYHLNGLLTEEGRIVRPPRPYVSYDLGNRIRYTGRRLSSTTLEPMRVRSITRRWRDDGSRSCTLVLNDLFVESQVALTRKFATLVNSATNPDAKPPATDPPPGEDTTVPATPTGLAGTSSVYLSTVTGQNFAIATLTWNPVTLNTDGSTVTDLGDYRVSYRYPDGASIGLPATWSGEVSASNTTVSIDRLAPGQTLEVRVRAVDRGGKWTGEYATGQLVLEPDRVPPPEPSVPSVSTRLGTVTVEWDGLDVAGEQMPADFLLVEVHVTTISDAALDQTTVVGRMGGAGIHVITDLPYNTPAYVSLRAVDNSGNESVPSDEALVTVTPLVNADLIGQVVTGANLIDGSIDASTKVQAGSVDTARLQVGTLNLVTDWLFQDAGIRTARAVHRWTFGNDSGTASNGHWYGILGSSTTFRLNPTESLNHDAASVIPVLPGAKYRFAVSLRRSSGYTATQGVRAVMDWVSSSGTPGSTVLGSYVQPTTSWVVHEWEWTAPADAARAIPSFQVSGMSAGQVFVHAPDFRAKTGGVLIEDGSVTAAKIAALAITADKIQANAITADKILAGAISATKLTSNAIDGRVITGSMLRTAATGLRTEIDGELKFISAGGRVARFFNFGDSVFGEAAIGLDTGFNNGGTVRASSTWQPGAILFRIPRSNGADLRTLEVTESYARLGVISGVNGGGIQLDNSTGQLEVQVRPDHYYRFYAQGYRANMEAYKDGLYAKLDVLETNGFNLETNAGGGGLVGFGGFGGQFIMRGRFGVEYGSATYSDQAVHTGSYVVGAGSSAINLSYGRTMSSVLRPIVSVDSAGRYSGGTATHSTTGFTVIANPRGTGGWNDAWRASYWCFR